MSDQASILARVREALQTPAPPRHLHSHGTIQEKRQKAIKISDWMPAVGPSWEERFALFQKNAEALRAELVSYSGLADLQAKLQDQAKREGWKKIATHPGSWSGPAVDALDVPRVLAKPGYSVREIEACEVGITECDALVAMTGTVVVSEKSSGGRTLSVLPAHHVVLARADQLVPDLESAFGVLRSLYAENWPSFLSFITGPSRTGDIERILVLGAHGPKRLTIYCGLPAEKSV